MSTNGGALPPLAEPRVATDVDILSRIQQALELVHSPFSDNESRRHAQSFLEDIKDVGEAPFQGYKLASDKSQSPVVRHYALSLLERAIRYRWASYSSEQAATLRNWILELSRAISRADPVYLRNKTAQLWVEVAKRCWGGEWMDMDAMLVQLWQVQDSPAHKEFVILVLETLSDDVFTGEDSAVAMREGVLSKACVEIFTPATVLAEAFPNRQPGPNVRQGNDGWLSRISEFLGHCLDADAKDNSDVTACTIKCFSLLLSLLPWAIPKAVAAARCVDVLTTGLASLDVDVQRVALEGLHALYSRTNLTDTEFLLLVVPMFSDASVQLCKGLYDSAALIPEDLDQDKYQVVKKLSEMLSCVGDYFERKFENIPSDAAGANFLRLLIHVVRSPSLVVSIPVLTTWARILANRALRHSELIHQMVGPLLDVCSSRLVRYENLPRDTADATYQFLLEDTDTIPERHVFLGNYRRYSCQVVELIVQLNLLDAIKHILGGTENALQHLYDGQPPFSKQNYSKYSMPALRVDAQFTLIEAALKGYIKWKRHYLKDQEQHAAEVERILESWCDNLLQINFEDPLIRKRTLQLLVYLSTSALNNNVGFMMKVLEHILLTWPALEPEHRAFNDAVKDLQGESMIELQRLAAEMSDHLLAVYDQIEERVNEMIASGALDEKRCLAYRSFLFLIIHRSSTLDTQAKVQKLSEFVEPVKALWQGEEVRATVSSYHSFCQVLALDKAQRYIASRKVHELADWGASELDAEGLALQSELENRLKALPLRATKSFLAFSVERLDKSSPAFHASYALWRDGFSNILADLLEYLRFSHATHNPENWVGLPVEMRVVVSRILSDRFWQAGISEGSKDEFYARVTDKKSTVEGLASTIRGSVRFVRETAYAIVYCMSRLDVQFYGFQGLSRPLSTALFADCIWLSTHQQSNLLNLVRYLVDDCPVDHREDFLPDLIASCFQQMDAKIHGEWEMMAHRQMIAADGEAELKEEMKAESILRQVSYTAVMMVADFLDPAKSNPPALRSRLETNAEHESRFPTLRRFCISRQDIVEPLLVFCTHAVRMRDTRCCGMTVRLLISLVPEFCADQARGQARANQAGLRDLDDGQPVEAWPIPGELSSAIREYISSNLLKACVTSFHEPHFVEVQKELASLIAAIVVYYGITTMTPRNTLLSLPNVCADELDRLTAYMAKPGAHTRQQRAIVLELLKDLKGVSVSELGKLSKDSDFGNTSRSKRLPRSRMAEGFMNDSMAAEPRVSRDGGIRSGTRGVTPDALEGVSNLFTG